MKRLCFSAAVLIPADRPFLARPSKIYLMNIKNNGNIPAGCRAYDAHGRIKARYFASTI